MALIEFNDYVNDEMSLQGFAFIPIYEYNAYMTKLRQHPEVFPYTYYYGSNDFVIYGSYTEFVKNFSVILISDTTVWEIRQYLKMYELKKDCYDYGFFPVIEEIFYEDEEDGI